MSEAEPGEQLAVSDEARAPLAFRVTGGGTPTPEELAAIVVALTPVAAPDADADSGPRGRALTGWQEAALLEGVGFRPFYSLTDVAAYHRSLA